MMKIGSSSVERLFSVESGLPGWKNVEERPFRAALGIGVSGL